MIDLTGTRCISVFVRKDSSGKAQLVLLAQALNDQLIVYTIITGTRCISVFVRKDSSGKAQLVLLDHGLYDHLKPDDRQALCLLFKSIVMQNEDDMKRYSKQLGVDGMYLPLQR